MSNNNNNQKIFKKQNKNKNYNNKRRPGKNRQPRRAIKFRPFTSVIARGYHPETSNYLLNKYKSEVIAYIKGTLEPELAVQEGLLLKQPSLFPIPSSGVGFRNNINIATDENGDFFLAWNPNYLINRKTVERYDIIGANVQFDCNTYSHLCSRHGNHMHFYPSYVPDVDLAKYRLVSAKIKITYIGSNLEKSGMLYGCATYDQTPVMLGYDPGASNYLTLEMSNGIEFDISNVTNYNKRNYPLYNAWSGMTEQKISNGIWNKNVNIVQTNQGISCIHIPSDPTNEIFYPMGSYFGFLPTSPGYQINGFTGDHGVVYPTQFVGESGSQLCYLICGHGLPVNKEVINIQTFYNFETIPTMSSAPFLKGTQEFMPAGALKIVDQVVKEVAPKIAIRTGKAGMLDSIKGTFTRLINNQKILSAVKIASFILPSLLKAF